MTRFGLQLPNFTLGVPDDQLFDRVVELAVTGEESGFSSLWVMDHLYQLPALGGDGRPLSSREAAAIMMERVIALLPRERRPMGADMLTIGGSSPAA